MDVTIIFPKRQYTLLRKHLFKGHKEQAGFLFVTTKVMDSKIEISVEDIYLIAPKGWDYQSSFHLDLNDGEKLKIVLEARRRGVDLIECHSHRCVGPAGFSRSDLSGFDEFVQYVWWKLPGKIYGAIVFTEDDSLGQIWLPKQKNEILINQIRIID